MMRSYFACVACSAKWFSEKQMRGCVRCGATGLLSEKREPPWVRWSMASTRETPERERTIPADAVQRPIYQRQEATVP